MKPIEVNFDKDTALATIKSWPEVALLKSDDDALQYCADLIADNILEIMQNAFDNEKSFSVQRTRKKIIVRKLIRSILLGIMGMIFVLLLALTNTLGNFKWAALLISLLPFTMLTIFPIIKLIVTAVKDDEAAQQYYEGEIWAKTQIAGIRGNLQAYMDIEEVDNLPPISNTLH